VWRPSEPGDGDDAVAVGSLDAAQVVLSRDGLGVQPAIGAQLFAWSWIVSLTQAPARRRPAYRPWSP
jgi:hypothetical protein